MVWQEAGATLLTELLVQHLKLAAGHEAKYAAVAAIAKLAEAQAMAGLGQEVARTRINLTSQGAPKWGQGIDGLNTVKVG